MIDILVTGGTFDKEYDERTGKLFFRGTHVKEMLRLGRSRVGVRIRSLMMKDSLHMTRADRLRIKAACKGRRIVVTHGTDTMVETAKILAALKGKTIVLTGAMVPYKFGSSDGLFNLGSALAFAQTLPVGVYVAMNGRVFRHDSVRKDKKRGVFVPA
jgi:L-asparaginase